MRSVLQLSLPFGNAEKVPRRRVGRRPKGARAGVPHLRRPAHCRRHPLHVTVRMRQGLPSLRSESMFRCILSQIRAARDRFLRILHFSVQSNHVHMLVEADDRERLAQGMKGFAVRVARHLNRLLGVRGAIWGDRYDARPLATPREVRRALVYVLRNWVKHTGNLAWDRCSSAAYLLGGWDEKMRPPVARGSPDTWPVMFPGTWLARIGWRRSQGVLGPDDVPSAGRREWARGCRGG